jgi:hypothetical protein
MAPGTAGSYRYDPEDNFVALQSSGFHYHGDDSGGPMLIASGNNELRLAGILSGGASASLGPGGPGPIVMRQWPRLFPASQLSFDVGFPWTKGVFTRTDKYKPWAEAQTRQTFP